GLRRNGQDRGGGGAGRDERVGCGAGLLVGGAGGHRAGGVLDSLLRAHAVRLAGVGPVEAPAARGRQRVAEDGGVEDRAHPGYTAEERRGGGPEIGRGSCRGVVETGGGGGSDRKCM